MSLMKGSLNTLTSILRATALVLLAIVFWCPQPHADAPPGAEPRSMVVMGYLKADSPYFWGNDRKTLYPVLLEPFFGGMYPPAYNVTGELVPDLQDLARRPLSPHEQEEYDKLRTHRRFGGQQEENPWVAVIEGVIRVPTEEISGTGQRSALGTLEATRIIRILPCTPDIEPALTGSTQPEFEDAVIAAQILEATGALDKAAEHYRAILEWSDVDGANQVLIDHCREHLELITRMRAADD